MTVREVSRDFLSAENELDAIFKGGLPPSLESRWRELSMRAFHLSALCVGLRVSRFSSGRAGLVQDVTRVSKAVQAADPAQSGNRQSIGGMQ